MAKDHSKSITQNLLGKEKEKNEADIEDKERIAEKDNVGNANEHEHFDTLRKFMCFRCKEIVSLNYKFNDDIKEDQICKLCTMFEAYGDT